MCLTLLLLLYLCAHPSCGQDEAECNRQKRDVETPRCSPESCVSCTSGCPCIECKPGFMTAPICSICANGFYGFECGGKCSPNCRQCHHVVGCRSCREGYTNPPACNTACPPGQYGPNCSGQCPDNCESCDLALGCIACVLGFTLPTCAGCPPGQYGPGCSLECSANCANCDPVGGCMACVPGFIPPTCENACPLGQYGPGCSLQCSTNCENCNRVSGCTACRAGFALPTCDTAEDVGTPPPITSSPNTPGPMTKLEEHTSTTMNPDNKSTQNTRLTDSNTNMNEKGGLPSWVFYVIGGLVGVILLLVVVFTFIYVRTKRRKSPSQSAKPVRRVYVTEGGAPAAANVSPVASPPPDHDYINVVDDPHRQDGDQGDYNNAYEEIGEITSDGKAVPRRTPTAQSDYHFYEKLKR